MATENEKRPNEFEKVNVSRIRLAPQTSAPANLEDGDIWYDAASDTLKARLNGATVTITTA